MTRLARVPRLACGEGVAQLPQGRDSLMTPLRMRRVRRTLDAEWLWQRCLCGLLDCASSCPKCSAEVILLYGLMCCGWGVNLGNDTREFAERKRDGGTIDGLGGASHADAPELAGERVLLVLREAARQRAPLLRQGLRRLVRRRSRIHALIPALTRAPFGWLEYPHGGAAGRAMPGVASVTMGPVLRTSRFRLRSGRSVGSANRPRWPFRAGRAVPARPRNRNPRPRRQARRMPLLPVP